MTELEIRLWMCLMVLVKQVKEDYPYEYETKDLEDAMSTAIDLINEVYEVAITGD